MVRCHPFQALTERGNRAPRAGNVPHFSPSCYYYTVFIQKKQERNEGIPIKIRIKNVLFFMQPAQEAVSFSSKIPSDWHKKPQNFVKKDV